MRYAPYRREKPIPRLKRNTFPKRFLFIDTETKAVDLLMNSQLQWFHLGVAIYVELDKQAAIHKRIVYRFFTIQQFLDILENLNKKRKRLIIVGHNIKFDIMVLDLPKRLSDLGHSHDYPIVNGKTFIWKVKTDKGSYLFMDTANYTGVSLAKMGKDLGIPKMTIDFDTCTNDELLEYCENDVIICENFILEYIRFILTHNYGDFKLTIASQAFTTWRHKFMDVQPVIHLNDAVNSIEKAAYHGGRTEALQIGDLSGIDYHKLDINSQYPAAMIGSKMPYQLIGHNQTPLPGMIEHHLEHNYLIVDCRLATVQPVFPKLIRVRRIGDNLELIDAGNNPTDFCYVKLMYPTGHYRAWLHHNEFAYAKSQGMVTQVYGYVVYKAADLFSSFVHEIYTQKLAYQKSGQLAFRYMAKIIANSLYGKFAQRWFNTTNLGQVDNDELFVVYGYNNQDGYRFVEINWFGTLYRTFATGLGTYSFPAIAGAITANARMMLWRYICLAGINNVFYMDTDSLIVNTQGYENLTSVIDPEKLGLLKHEGTSQHLVIHGAKDYQFGDETRIKGVPRKHRMIDANTFRYLDFEGFNMWRNRGAKGPPITQYVTKQRKTVYDKAKIAENGRTIPYQLPFPQVPYRVPRPDVVNLFPGIEDILLPL